MFANTQAIKFAKKYNLPVYTQVNECADDSVALVVSGFTEDYIAACGFENTQDAEKFAELNGLTVRK